MAPFDVSQISNVNYIESMYAQYKANPEGVDPQWQAFFAGFDLLSDGRNEREEKRVAIVMLSV